MKYIFRNFIIFLVVGSMLILMTGIFETARNQYYYNIIEDDFINAENTPADIHEDYLDFKNHYIFSDNIFLDILNFIGLIALLYIFVSAWRAGWKTPKRTLSDIFLSYGLMAIIVIYLFVSLFNYLANIYVNQVILILFEDIYNGFYIFRIFIEYFIPLFLIALTVNYLANQLSNFAVFE